MGSQTGETKGASEEKIGVEHTRRRRRRPTDARSRAARAAGVTKQGVEHLMQATKKLMYAGKATVGVWR